MLWTPVMAGKAAWWEICNCWTVKDLYACLELMEIESAYKEAEAEAIKKERVK